LYQRWTAEEVLALPSEQQHQNYLGSLNMGCEDPTSYHFHPILLRENSFLVSGTGFDVAVHPLVLSAHHQAVEQLGKGWRVAATSMDGKVIEAIEHEAYPYVFGVQFHPEKPGLYDPSIIHPESCDRTISFNETIRGTDSYSFHLAYWGYLGKVMREKRDNKVKETREKR
jgi:putative glutamine amidotransferase